MSNVAKTITTNQSFTSSWWASDCLNDVASIKIIYENIFLIIKALNCMVDDDGTFKVLYVVIVLCFVPLVNTTNFIKYLKHALPK